MCQEALNIPNLTHKKYPPVTRLPCFQHRRCVGLLQSLLALLRGRTAVDAAMLATRAHCGLGCRTRRGRQRWQIRRLGRGTSLVRLAGPKSRAEGQQGGGPATWRRARHRAPRVPELRPEQLVGVLSYRLFDPLERHDAPTRIEQVFCESSELRIAPSFPWSKSRFGYQAQCMPAPSLQRPVQARP